MRFSEPHLARVSGGADAVQQAQPTLGVRVGDLSAGRMPGQAANGEAFLVLLSAEATSVSPSRRRSRASAAALGPYLSTHSLLFTSHTVSEPPTEPAARNRPHGDQAATLTGCRAKGGEYVHTEANEHGNHRHRTCAIRSSDRVLTCSQDPRSYRLTFVSTGTAKSYKRKPSG